MEKRLFSIVLLFFGMTACVGLRGQNLLPNPGFEVYSACPGWIAEMWKATGWNNPTNHTGSADYHHVCGTNAWVQVPSNAFGSQMPHAGNAYMGFALFYQSTPGFREYIYCQLTPALGLTAGQTYTISWYVSAGDNSSMATDDLQFYLSAAAPTWVGNWNSMTTYTPQCAIPSGTFITNKLGWNLVSATFTAAGGERYLTMGNFLLDGATSVMANGAGAYNTGYVYFDDGVLQPSVILSADLQELKAEENGNSVALTWETKTETDNLKFVVERSVGDYQHFEAIGERMGAGNSSEALQYIFDDPGYTPGVMNYYRLKVVDNNGEFSFSNAVGVETRLSGTHFVNSHPNPAQVGMPIQLTFSMEVAQPIHVLLIDMQGREVRNMTFDGEVGLSKVAFPTSGLPAGQYLMRAQSGMELVVKRITLL